jgi:hypothetical protein
VLASVRYDNVMSRDSWRYTKRVTLHIDTMRLATFTKITVASAVLLLLGWAGAQLLAAPRREYQSDWIPVSLAQSDFNVAMSYVLADNAALFPTPRVVVRLRSEICSNREVIDAFSLAAKKSRYPIELRVEHKACQIP